MIQDFIIDFEKCSDQGIGVFQNPVKFRLVVIVFKKDGLPVRVIFFQDFFFMLAAGQQARFIIGKEDFHEIQLLLNKYVIKYNINFVNNLCCKMRCWT